MLPNPFLKNRSGIYAIRSLDTGKVYVGRTKCFFQRCKQYVNAFHIESVKHLNDYLRDAFNKYGMDRFEMFPLEFCSVEDSCEREVYWMNVLQSFEKETGYNLRKDSYGGMTTSHSTSEKISARLKKEWASGARSHHAQMLRDKWASDQQRKNAQSIMLSRMKTKWVYNITHPDGVKENTVFFKRLKDLGLTNAQHSFHKNKKDTVSVKGFVVERLPFNRKDTYS